MGSPGLAIRVCWPAMKRGWVVLLLLLACAAGAWFWMAVDDPEYVLREHAALGQFSRYDEEIAQAARRYGVKPELIKAVVWRESRFRPEMRGTRGERGLMQVTEGAAQEWAKAENVETFSAADLFDPKVNLEAGTWYLARALSHWGTKDDPAPFALAEYNAGRTRVNRWVNDSGQGPGADAKDLRTAMDFPATKGYVAAIAARAAYYARRGDFAK